MKNSRRNVLKSRNGITLVALVVTIIVLIILAGISISLVLGDNGIITKAKDAKTETERGEVYEQISLATASGEMEYYSNGTDRITAYKNALLNGVDGIDRDNLTDNGSSLITGTVTTKSGKQYDFSVPVPVTDITVAEHKEKVLEITPVYAKLYNDGTLILSSTDYTDSSKTLTKDFGLVENKNDSNYWSASDYNTLVTKVSFYDGIVPSTTAYYFNNLSNLTTFENMSNLETSLVTDMQYMFAGCTSLTSIDVSHFDTRNVTDMSHMFAGAYFRILGASSKYYYTGKISTLDLSNFDTSNVTDMSYMFAYQVSLESLTLKNFDTSNVTNMAYMFSYCPSLQNLDLSGFDTSKVTSMAGMFICPTVTDPQGGLSFYYNNNSGVTSSLTTIYVSKLWDISNVGIQASTSLYMFNGCVSLVGAISYDSSKTNQTVANYTTGYLTYKSNS